MSRVSDKYGTREATNYMSTATIYKQHLINKDKGKGWCTTLGIRIRLHHSRIYQDNTIDFAQGIHIMRDPRYI